MSRASVASACLLGFMAFGFCLLASSQREGLKVGGGGGESGLVHDLEKRALLGICHGHSRLSFLLSSTLPFVRSSISPSSDLLSSPLLL